MAQQNPVDAGMRDERRAALRALPDIGQRGQHARQAVLVGLAAWRAGVRRAVPKILRIPGVQFVKGQTVSFAAVKLDEAV